MESKRLCCVCNKPLAEANKEDRCFCHQTGMLIHEHTPVTGCTSWSVSDETGENSPKEVPSPGEPGYNEMAFSKDIVGAIDEDGDLYQIDLGETDEEVATVYGGDRIIDEAEMERQEKENKEFEI